MGIVHSGSYGSPRLDLGEAMMEFIINANEFIGTRVWPWFKTSRKKASFSVITRESLLRPGKNVKRAPKSAYQRDEFEPEDKSYECVERGHEAMLDDSDRAHYQHDFQAERLCVQVAMRRVKLDQEIDIAASVFDGTTNFTVANGKRTDVSTAWTNAGADIIGDVQTAKEAVRGRVGDYANALIIGASQVPNLLKNTAIRSALGDDKEKGIKFILDRLRALLGIEHVLIGTAVYNTADEGQAYSGSDVWGSGWASVARIATDNDPLQMPSFGRSMLWVEDSPEAVMVEDYPEAQTRSQVYRARMHADELLIDTAFAQLLDTAG
jgi:hypothetical protein